MTYVRWLGYLAAIAFFLIVGCEPRSKPVAPIKQRPVVASTQAAAAKVAKLEAEVRSDFNPAINFAFGNCGDPCVVKFNRGGSVLLYAVAAEGMLNGARKGLIIDGPCASACAMAADFASDVTCITPNAVFGFHGTSDGIEPPHNPRLAAYVRSHGGFPSYQSGIINWMSYRKALMFWSPCA